MNPEIASIRETLNTVQSDVEEVLLDFRNDLPLMLGELSVELAMANSGYREAIDQFIEFTQVLGIEDHRTVPAGPTRKVLDVLEDNVIHWNIRAAKAGRNYADGVRDLMQVDAALHKEGTNVHQLRGDLTEKQSRPTELTFPYSDDMNPYRSYH